MANGIGGPQGKEPGQPHPGQTLQTPGQLPEDESVSGVIDDERDEGASDSDIISDRGLEALEQSEGTAGGR